MSNLLFGDESPKPANGNLLYFDVETVPDESRYTKPDIPETSDVDVCDIAKLKVDEIKPYIEKMTCQNMVDLESVELNKQKPRAGVLNMLRSESKRRVSVFSDWSKEGSINPLWNRIVGIGWAVDNSEAYALTAKSLVDEQHILQKFWDVFTSCRRCVGYNILNFDLTVLGFRSMLLNVKIPGQLTRNRYRNDMAIDIMRVIFGDGKPQKCKDVAAACGIEIPAGDVDGSDVYDLFVKGDMDSIANYVKSDVVIERELYRRFRPIFHV